MKEIINEYAEALFALAAEKGSVEEYSSSLDDVKKLLEENEEYTEFLFCPSLPLSERLSSIDEAFSAKMPEDIISFLKILTENGRIRELSYCIDEFMKLNLLWENALTVTVCSSIPLSDGQKDELIKKLSAKYKKEVYAVYEVDEALIGGVKIIAGDLLIDGSIENRLKTLKEVIEK